MLLESDVLNWACLGHFSWNYRAPFMPYISTGLAWACSSHDDRRQTHNWSRSSYLRVSGTFGHFISTNILLVKAVTWINSKSSYKKIHSSSSGRNFRVTWQRAGIPRKEKNRGHSCSLSQWESTLTSQTSGNPHLCSNHLDTLLAYTYWWYFKLAKGAPANKDLDIIQSNLYK